MVDDRRPRLSVVGGNPSIPKRGLPEPEPPEFDGNLLQGGFVRSASLKVGEELVQRLLPAKRLAVLYGEPGCGKSTIAYGIAFAMATGSRFLDRQVTQSSVVYLAAERDFDVDTGLLAHERLTGHATNNILLLSSKSGLNALDQSKELEGEIMDAIAHCNDETSDKCRLVIIDTLAAITPGSEEQAADYTEVADMLRRIIKRKRVTIVLIAHEGKDHKRGIRGSNALMGAADVTIRVGRIEDYRLNSGVMQIKKTNVRLDLDELHFSVALVEMGKTEWGDLIEVAVVAKLEKRGKASTRKPKSRYEPAIREIMGALLADSGKRKQLPRWARQHAEYDVQLCVRREDVDAAIAAMFPGDASSNQRKTVRRAVTSLVSKGAVLGGATSSKGESVLWPKGAWTAEQEAGDDVDEA